MSAVAQTSSLQTISVRNPATGEPIGEVPVRGADEVREAVRRARLAQASWAVLSVEERCKRVRRLRDVYVRRAEELADLLVRECGKTRNEALTMEVVLLADLATYFCKRAPKILAPERIPLHLLLHRRSMLHYLPRGVVGIISPWNFPLSI